MKKGKRHQNNRTNACLIAVWLLLTMLSGLLMLMLSTSQVQASESESDLPEVLRYAQEYTRTTGNRVVLQTPEASLSRKLARSELIRRQQRARIETLEKKLKALAEVQPAVTKPAPDVNENVARLTRELKASGETLHRMTQQLGQTEKEKVALQEQLAAGKTVLTQTQAKVQALQAELNAGKTALSRADAGLKKETADVKRLASELASVRRNAEALNKQKKELEASLTEMKARTRPVSLKTAEQRQAYAAGVMYARDVREARDGNRMLGINLDTSALSAGLTDALVGKKLRLTPEVLAEATHSLEKSAARAFRTVTARQAKLAENWLEKFRKEKGTSRDESGFWYRVIYEGDGENLKQDDIVDVVVEERLADETVVSDMDRSGSSLRQKVADFPPVFSAALLRLKNHGQITLAVPPELAYGDRGYPPDVPPGAMMIYNLRVSDVIPAESGKAAGR
ncbi:hypothetical protein E5475_20710 [Salmonella enterica]|nr:hypothetical protein [Salmonella enterica]EHM1373160.1 FKBP-type peptidyl-prolyl cis-trans isomerase [Salmonella enterica]